VWRDVESLADYAFRSGHVEIMRRRREWFLREEQATAVLWWVPRGHRPTLAEAAERLELLRRDGPSPLAFTFRHAFAAPGTTPDAVSTRRDDVCPAT
jgi:hypothetical protein